MRPKNLFSKSEGMTIGPYHYIDSSSATLDQRLQYTEFMQSEAIRRIDWEKLRSLAGTVTENLYWIWVLKGDYLILTSSFAECIDGPLFEEFTKNKQPNDNRPLYTGGSRINQANRNLKEIRESSDIIRWYFYQTVKHNEVKIKPHMWFTFTLLSGAEDWLSRWDYHLHQGCASIFDKKDPSWCKLIKIHKMDNNSEVSVMEIDYDKLFDYDEKEGIISLDLISEVKSKAIEIK